MYSEIYFIMHNLEYIFGKIENLFLLGAEKIYVVAEFNGLGSI